MGHHLSGCPLWPACGWLSAPFNCFPLTAGPSLHLPPRLPAPAYSPISALHSHPAPNMSTKVKAPKPAPAHPPYVDMIVAAVKALKERTGSSAPAIGKFIGATYKVPAGFEKTLALQLKRLAAAGKLVKVKASFKLSEALKKVRAAGRGQK